MANWARRPRSLACTGPDPSGFPGYFRDTGLPLVRTRGLHYRVAWRSLPPQPRCRLSLAASPVEAAEYGCSRLSRGGCASTHTIARTEPDPAQRVPAAPRHVRAGYTLPSAWVFRACRGWCSCRGCRRCRLCRRCRATQGAAPDTSHKQPRSRHHCSSAATPCSPAVWCPNEGGSWRDATHAAHHMVRVLFTDMHKRMHRCRHPRAFCSLQRWQLIAHDDVPAHGSCMVMQPLRVS